MGAIIYSESIGYSVVLSLSIARKPAVKIPWTIRNSSESVAL